MVRGSTEAAGASRRAMPDATLGAGGIGRRTREQAAQGHEVQPVGAPGHIADDEERRHRHDDAGHAPLKSSREEDGPGEIFTREQPGIVE